MKSLSQMKWLVVAAASMAAVGLVAGLLTDADAGEKKYELRYKLKKGTAFEMSTTTERQSRREVMGNVIEATTTDRMAYEAQVTGTKDGAATVELTYKDRTHETDDPQVQLDTDFSALLGKTARFAMTPRGELSGFEAFDALPEIPISGGQAMHGENQYIREVKEFFIQLPEDKIAVGDTWSYTDEFSEPVDGGAANVVIEYTYTLAETGEKNGHDCVKLAGEYTSKVTGTGTAQGMEYTIKLGGTGTETAWFAVKEGMLLEVESSSFVEGAVVAEDVGFEMPMRHKYTSTRMFSLD